MEMCGQTVQYPPHTSCAWLGEHWGTFLVSAESASEPDPVASAPCCRCSLLIGQASEQTERSSETVKTTTCLVIISTYVPY